MGSFRVLIMMLQLVIIVKRIESDCNVCQEANSVACHSKNTFSLCVDDLPTEDYIECPDNMVCTDKELICYPEDSVVPSCDDDQNSCGICNSSNKLFACISETKIAYCFGNDQPYYDAIANCPENTVCDLNNAHDICTDITKATASCKTSDSTTIATTSSIAEDSTTTTNIEPTTTKTTNIESTTTSINTEPILTTTTNIKPTTTTNIESTTTSINTEPIPTTTTIIPTTNAQTPDEACEGFGEGNHPWYEDTTCTKFLVCYKSDNNHWIGVVSSCAEGTFFQDYCTTTVPERCR